MYIIVPTPGSPRTCNIISTNIPTLTTPGREVANGKEDVILYCICLEDGVAVGPTIWFFNDTRVTATQANGNSPYYRNKVPSPLIIPVFVTGNDGTYRCESTSSTPTPDDSITLTLSGTYLFNYLNKLLINFMFVLIMAYMFMSAIMTYVPLNQMLLFLFKLLSTKGLFLGALGVRWLGNAWLYIYYNQFVKLYTPALHCLDFQCIAPLKINYVRTLSSQLILLYKMKYWREVIFGKIMLNTF